MKNTTLQITCAGLSDVGHVREHNEDAWAAHPEIGLFLVADGIGGHQAGEVAAAESVKELYEHVKQWHPTNQPSVDEAISYFREAVIKVNAQIVSEGKKDPALTGMGTTLCALYFLHDHAILTHVGDSRIYGFRENKLEQLTEDHSLVAEFESHGMTAPDNIKHIITRSIGKDLDLEPSVEYLSTEPKDLFLLCSDGLTNFVEDDQIEAILAQDTPLEQRAQTLVNLANENGGGDNITVLLVSLNG